MNVSQNRILLAALAMILSPSRASAQEDWNRFRGPNGTGKASVDCELPSSWSESENVQWKIPVHRGSSSPVFCGEKVILTGYSGYAQGGSAAGDRDDLMLHVMAYNFETGQELWDVKFPASENEQEASKRIADHGYASPTPCSDGEMVFATFGPSGIFALNDKGQLLWKRDIGDGTAGFGAASSPITYENLVIINASIESKRILAFEKRTGNLVWELDGIERAWTTPSIASTEQGDELVIHFKNEVRGVNPLTGDVLWYCEGIPDYVVPVPVVENDVIYFSGGRQNRTLAIRAGGRGNVTESHLLWQVNRGANVTTPLYHEGYLYWAHDKAFSQAMDATSGELAYQERFRNRARVYGSVVYGDGKLFMTLRDGNVLVLEAAPKFNQLSVNKLGTEGEDFNATPAIRDSSLLIRSTRFLYRVGK